MRMQHSYYLSNVDFSMQYSKALPLLGIFLVLAQVFWASNLFLGVFYQRAFGEVSGNVTNLTKAIVLNSIGRFDDALPYLDKALLIDPNNVLALINKGISLDGLGRFDEEMTYYDKALSIDPNNKNAINNEAAVLINLGKIDQAIQYYDKALSIDPNNTTTVITSPNIDLFFF